MTDHKSTNIEENLRLGIDAARIGNDKAARAHLIAVLKRDPDNIPALLWLAFVLSSPEDTIRVLKRVLALDPNNERAKAGIRWARGRLGLDPDEPETQANALTDTAESALIRQQLLSGDLQKQAKKGVLAHRARRTIRPLLIIILVTGVVGLASIGVGALALVPPETLAAWLPASIPKASPESMTVFGETDPSLTQPAEVAQMAGVQSMAAGSDSLARPGFTAPEADISKASPLPLVAESGTNAFVPPLDTGLRSVELSSFIGPEAVSTIAEAPVPGDNLLLAHQPAYPGEKWIEVNLTTQQVTAWEGDVPVFNFLTSTGLPNTPTVSGEYRIYWKLEKALMTGVGYYLPDVPYTMYFYGSYALHGTYWHDNFGQPMSHGCVNLETGNAEKLFNWADPVLLPGQTQVTASDTNPGTLVVVHQ